MVAHLFLKKLTLVILGLTLSLVVQSGVIVNQGLNRSDNYGFISTKNGYNTADNFSLGSRTSLQGITWYGSYFDPTGALTTPISPPSSETFDITIFDSLNSSAPTLLSLLSFSVNRVELTPVLYDALEETIFEYEVTLSNYLTLDAGVYFLSIINIDVNDSLEWAWSDSTVGDGVVYYRDSISESWDVDSVGNPEGLDAAFVLAGEPVVTVPEPATPLLVLAGMLALLFSKRRRV